MGRFPDTARAGHWRWRLAFFLGSASAFASVFPAARAAEPTDLPSAKKIAAIVTIYTHNSHADMIVSRLLQTDTLDGKGKDSPFKLASLYTDQKPEKDISRSLAASHRFRVSPSIEDALTLGTGRLAVDGVLLIAEHGEYPKSAVGSNTTVPGVAETLRIAVLDELQAQNALVELPRPVRVLRDDECDD